MTSDDTPDGSRSPQRDAVPPLLSRRALLAGAAVTGAVTAGGAAAGGAAAGGAAAGGAAARPAGPQGAAGFHGDHQAGIATPPLPYLSLAAFDVVTRGRDTLERLLRTWTGVAERLTGAAARPPATGPVGVPGALTLTFGFGPSLFAVDRFAIAGRRPAPLVPLPPFAGDAVDPAASHGDLCVQACAGDPGTAHQAVRDLLNAARPQVSLRWRQSGFRTEDGTADPRGLFGFRDGTANLEPARHADDLWVDDGPGWLHGGSYLVMRRIRLLLDTWDRTALPDQETAVGRERDSNRRLHLAEGAHAALASPRRNGGVRLLRRSYSYDAGVDPNGLLDSGLIFLSYQRHPEHFVRVQRRLAGRDPLNGFSQHLAGAVFACPPGIRPGSYVGAELLS